MRLTLQQLAEETGVSARTIRTWIEEGLVPKSHGRSNYGNYSGIHVKAVQQQNRLRHAQQQLRDERRNSRIVYASEER